MTLQAGWRWAKATRLQILLSSGWEIYSTIGRIIPPTRLQPSRRAGRSRWPHQSTLRTLQNRTIVSTIYRQAPSGSSPTQQQADGARICPSLRKNGMTSTPPIPEESSPCSATFPIPHYSYHLSGAETGQASGNDRGDQCNCAGCRDPRPVEPVSLEQLLTHPRTYATGHLLCRLRILGFASELRHFL